MNEDLEAAYFDWLCAKVLDHDNRAYLDLLVKLHREEFMWLLLMDENRAQDGRDLRKDFFRETFGEGDPEWLHIGCSVLEMLIALAKRAQFQTGTSTKSWFWEMIHNMGIVDPFITDREFGDFMHTFIWRLYEPNGKDGSIFPVLEKDVDMRKTELWYQLCFYIEENHLV